MLCHYLFVSLDDKALSEVDFEFLELFPIRYTKLRFCRHFVKRPDLFQLQKKFVILFKFSDNILIIISFVATSSHIFLLFYSKYLVWSHCSVRIRSKLTDNTDNKCRQCSRQNAKCR